jgi:hypothetical protein
MIRFSRLCFSMPKGYTKGGCGRGRQSEHATISRCSLESMTDRTKLPVRVGIMPLAIASSFALVSIEGIPNGRRRHYWWYPWETLSIGLTPRTFGACPVRRLICGPAQCTPVSFHAPKFRSSSRCTAGAANGKLQLDYSRWS